MTKTKAEQMADFHRGWEAGNYANSYGGEDLDESHDNLLPEDLDNDSFYTGYVIGFYSSYEPHEIPEIHRDTWEQEYACDLAQLAVREGAIDARSELDD